MLCDLKPSGRYVATDLHRAGGVPQVMKMLLDHGLLHGDALTITGQTIAENLADVPAEPPAGQDVIRPCRSPLYAQGHLAILRGNLATEGAVAKITGVKSPKITGPARVFDSRGGVHRGDPRRPDPAGRRGGHPLRGAEGRPGHARDARRRPRRSSAPASATRSG